MKIAFSPIYKYQLPEGHRFPMEKYELLPEQLLYEGTISESQFFHPQKLSKEHFLWTHSLEYWDKLHNNELSRKEIRKIGFPMRPELVERGRYIAQGTIECALHAMSEGCSMNVAGGTHHSFRGHGEGFCVYNDFALTAHYLLNKDLVSKVLIVDLDVHQGNGTASIFEEDERVFTFSMHGEKNYPHRKEKSDLDIGLPDGCEDELYLTTLEKQLPSVIDEVEPDIILYLSGVDILGTDKLGRLNVSLEGCRKRDQFVFEQAHINQIPVTVSMGGGYSEKIADIVNAHAQTYREAMRVFF